MSKPLKIFGIKLKNEKKLLESQSGGAFSLIAEHFIEQGAVVYGVGQNSNNDAIYMKVETVDDLSKIKGSKYVQAKLGNTYHLIKNDLEKGKVVLFSGTPCYVYAMKLYVEMLKNKDNLYTVDLICHGVPSPKVYHNYLQYLEKQVGARVKKFVFRDKNYGGSVRKLKSEWLHPHNAVKKSGKVVCGQSGGGWHEHVEKIIYENGDEEYREEYTQLFYTNLPIRPSCGNCQFSNMNRIGDFTVGDYWGVNRVFPEFDDERGVSLIFCNNNRSVQIFELLLSNVEYIETDEEHAALQHNLKQSSNIPKQSKQFWKDFNNKGIGYCIKHWSPIGGYPFRIKRKLLKLLKAW